MVAVVREIPVKRERKKIPEALVYEIMNGKPIYYNDYQLVINKEKTIDEVMGSSSLLTHI